MARKKKEPASNIPAEESMTDESGILKPKVVTDRLEQVPGYNRPLQEQADVTEASVSESPIDDFDAKTMRANQALAEREAAEAAAAAQRHDNIRGEISEKARAAQAAVRQTLGEPDAVTLPFDNPITGQTSKTVAAPGGLSGRTGFSATADPYIPLRGRMPVPERIVERAPGFSASSAAALADWNESHRRAKETAQKSYFTFHTNYGIRGAGAGLDRGLVDMFEEHEAAGCNDPSCAAERRRLAENDRPYGFKAFLRTHSAETGAHAEAIRNALIDQHARQKELAPSVPHILDPHVDVTEDEWKNKPQFQYHDNLYNIGSALLPSLPLKEAANEVRKALYRLTPQGQQTALANARTNAKNIESSLFRDESGNIDLGQHAKYEEAGGTYRAQKLQTALNLQDADLSSWATGAISGNDVQTMARRISGILRKARGGIGSGNRIDPGFVTTYLSNAKQILASGSTDLTDLQRKAAGNMVGAEEVKGALATAADVSAAAPATNIDAVLENIKRLTAITGGGKETAARNRSGFDRVQGARGTDVDLRKASVQAARRIPHVVLQMADSINSIPTLAEQTGKPVDQLQAIADSASMEYDPEEHGLYGLDTSDEAIQKYIERGIPNANQLLSKGTHDLYEEHESTKCENSKCEATRKRREKAGKRFTFEDYKKYHGDLVSGHEERIKAELIRQGRAAHVGSALSEATQGIAIDPQHLVNSMVETVPSLTTPGAQDIVTAERPALRPKTNEGRLAVRDRRRAGQEIQAETGVAPLPEPGPGVATAETRTENVERVRQDARQRRGAIRAARKTGRGNPRQFGE